MPHERITISPAIMLGKPVIKGTRITVELILRRLGGGLSVENTLSEYPQLSPDDIQAAHAFAADCMANAKVLRSCDGGSSDDDPFKDND